MSRWAKKYVIGLTGNIGTGKSVVRKMLEHHGAYGIDADALAHRAIVRGSVGYEAVLQSFGRAILLPDGEIDRGKLGGLVFNDPVALKQLENIVHPLVAQMVDVLIGRAEQQVIVIEAIKLIEAEMNKDCDSLWVVYAPQEMQLSRLVEKRKMSQTEARQRIAAQPPQELKMAVADVIIRNESTFEDVWNQVTNFWKLTVPPQYINTTSPTEKDKATQNEICILHGNPAQSQQIADLINRLSSENPPLTPEKIMEAFGEKTFLLLKMGNDLMGIMSWNVENLVARALEFFIDPQVPMERALPPLIREMEIASQKLQCEVSFVFVPPELARLSVWQALGYEPCRLHDLGVKVWQEAAQESLKAGKVMLFKSLRKESVLSLI